MSLVSDGLTFGARAPSDNHSPSIRLLNISMGGSSVVTSSLGLVSRTRCSVKRCAASGERRLPPVRLPPHRKILWRLLVGRRIEAEDRAALADLFSNKIL